MSHWIPVAGWTLVHFVWEGCVLLVLAWVVLRLCRQTTAAVRYSVAGAALALMLAAPIATAVVLTRPDVEPSTLERTRSAFSLSESQGSTPSGFWPVVVPTAATVALVERSLPMVVIAWLCGVGLLVIRVGGGLWRVHRLHRKGLATRQSPWQAAVDRLATTVRAGPLGRSFGLGAHVHVAESALVTAPTVVGWLRPVVLLPLAGLAQLTPRQVEAILVHEFAHVRRHDYAVNLLQTLAETLLFYHPAVWWISNRIRAEREHCCDDIAVSFCDSPADYAAALVELEASRSGSQSLALAATDGPLVRRVRRVLGMPAEDESRGMGVVVAVATTAVMLVGAAAGEGRFWPWSTTGSGRITVAVQAAAQNEPLASPASFDWRVVNTDHFEIHYYPAVDEDLQQVGDTAEEAYVWLSGELEHELSFRVPLILFETREDFERQGIAPGADLSFVRSFSEPGRDRVVLLVDEHGEDLSYRITHEVTHIFMFDLIPRSQTGPSGLPAWFYEGIAEYMTAAWPPDEFAQVRALVESGAVPLLTNWTPGAFENVRSFYNLGRVVFEFIEATYGKDGMRRFVRAFPSDGTVDTDTVYEEAFNVTASEFEQALAAYVRERFAPA